MNSIFLDVVIAPSPEKIGRMIIAGIVIVAIIAAAIYAIYKNANK